MLNLFENHIFPRIDSSVGPWCTYERYEVIPQGDNLGLHNETI